MPMGENKVAWGFFEAKELLTLYCRYDGSMMNGLQSLDEWKSYFHNPGANTLALYANVSLLLSFKS
jgi:hypothetical protein